MKYLAIILIYSFYGYFVHGQCNDTYQVICFWGSWSIYRTEGGQFTTEHIDPNLCTTIVYSFIGLDLNLQTSSLDVNADISRGGFANVTALRDVNPCLKVVLAIGGWNEGSRKYSVAAYSKENREKFAESVLNFVVYYGFDGIDVDWEYPNSRGGIQSDYENFPLLIETLKKTLSPWGLSVSIAVSVSESSISKSYNISSIARYVDYVCLMAYDYVSSTSDITGLSAPLHEIKKSVNLWLNGGLPSQKLMLGIPTYARTFILKDSSKHDIGDPVKGPAVPGIYTQQAGFLAYYELLEIFKYGSFNKVHCNGTNYAYLDQEWFTFETEESVKEKVKYATDQKLGGIMVWSLETDDFRGTYGKTNPLITAVRTTLKQA